MVKSILDTDILSEYLKGYDPAVIKHAGRYAKEHGVFTLDFRAIQKTGVNLLLENWRNV